MSAMIVGSLDRFFGMAQKLEDSGITSMHLCCAKNDDDLDITALALVPFVDIVILSKDAHSLPYLNKIVSEAQLRHIPVLPEERVAAEKNDA